jgi:hypothetical protein
LGIGIFEFDATILVVDGSGIVFEWGQLAAEQRSADVTRAAVELYFVM